MHVDLELEEEIASIMQDAQWLEALYKGTMVELRTISQLQGLPSRARLVCGEESSAQTDHHSTQPAYRTRSKRQQPRPRAHSGDDTAPTIDGGTTHRSYERGLEQLRAKAAKEEKLRAQLQMEQEAGAMFQPKTTAKAKALTRGVGGMLAWEESRKSRQAVRRKQRLDDEQKAQLAAPRLNARSRELVQQRQSHRPSTNGNTSALPAEGKRHSSNLNKRSASVPAGARQRDRISSTRSRPSSSSSSSSRVPSKSPARSRSTERPVRHATREQAIEAAATAPSSRQYRRQSAAQLDHDILQFEEGVLLREPESRTATRRIRLLELESRNVQPYATSSKRSSTPHRAAASAADPSRSFDEQLWLQYRTARDTPAPRTPAAKLASRTQRDTTSMYTSPPYEDGIAA